MEAVPGAMPFTRPAEAEIVAIAVLLLVQLPPVVASLSSIDAPWQTAGVPVIEDGRGTTVTGTDDRHPVVSR